jgi:hypothetical protein
VVGYKVVDGRGASFVLLGGKVSTTLLVVDPLRVFVPISNLLRDGFHEVDPFR